jgi:hypothetical protein
MSAQQTPSAQGQSPLFAVPATALGAHGPGWKPIHAHKFPDPDSRGTCVRPAARAAARRSSSTPHQINDQEPLR